MAAPADALSGLQSGQGDKPLQPRAQPASGAGADAPLSAVSTEGMDPVSGSMDASPVSVSGPAVPVTSRMTLGDEVYNIFAQTDTHAIQIGEKDAMAAARKAERVLGGTVVPPCDASENMFMYARRIFGLLKTKGYTMHSAATRARLHVQTASMVPSKAVAHRLVVFMRAIAGLATDLETYQDYNQVGNIMMNVHQSSNDTDAVSRLQNIQTMLQVVTSYSLVKLPEEFMKISNESKTTMADVAEEDTGTTEFAALVAQLKETKILLSTKETTESDLVAQVKDFVQKMLSAYKSGDSSPKATFRRSESAAERSRAELLESLGAPQLFLRPLGKEYEKAGDYGDAAVRVPQKGESARNPCGTLVASGNKLNRVAFRRDLVHILALDKVYKLNTMKEVYTTKGELRGDIKIKLDEIQNLITTENIACIAPAATKRMETLMDDLTVLYGQDPFLGKPVGETFDFTGAAPDVISPEIEPSGRVAITEYAGDHKPDAQRLAADHRQQSVLLQMAIATVPKIIQLSNGAFLRPGLTNQQVWTGAVEQLGELYPPGLVTGMCRPFANALKSLDKPRSARVFAIGYSGTGKTHTLQGSDKADPGMLPRIIVAQLNAVRGQITEPGTYVVVLDAVELVLAKNDLSDEASRLRGKLIGYNLQDKDGNYKILTLVDNTVESSGVGTDTAIRSAVSAHARFHRGREIGGNPDEVTDQVTAFLSDLEQVRQQINEISSTLFNPASSRGHLFLTAQVFETKHERSVGKPIVVADMAGFEDTTSVLMGMLNHAAASEEASPYDWEMLARLPANTVRKLSPDWKHLVRLPCVNYLNKFNASPGYASCVIAGMMDKSPGASWMQMEDTGVSMRRVLSHTFASIVADRANRVLQILQTRLVFQPQSFERAIAMVPGRSLTDPQPLPVMALHMALVSLNPKAVIPLDEFNVSTVTNGTASERIHPLELRAVWQLREGVIQHPWRYRIESAIAKLERIRQNKPEPSMVDAGAVYWSRSTGTWVKDRPEIYSNPPITATEKKFNVEYLGPAEHKVSGGMFINATIQTFLLQLYRSVLRRALASHSNGNSKVAGSYRFGAENIKYRKQIGFLRRFPRLADDTIMENHSGLPPGMRSVLVRSRDLPTLAQICDKPTGTFTLTPNLVRVARDLGRQIRLQSVATTSCRLCYVNWQTEDFQVPKLNISNQRPSFTTDSAVGAALGWGFASASPSIVWETNARNGKNKFKTIYPTLVPREDNHTITSFDDAINTVFQCVQVQDGAEDYKYIALLTVWTALEGLVEANQNGDDTTKSGSMLRRLLEIVQAAVGTTAKPNPGNRIVLYAHSDSSCMDQLTAQQDAFALQTLLARTVTLDWCKCNNQMPRRNGTNAAKPSTMLGLKAFMVPSGKISDDVRKLFAVRGTVPNLPAQTVRFIRAFLFASFETKPVPVVKSDFDALKETLKVHQNARQVSPEQCFLYATAFGIDPFSFTLDPKLRWDAPEPGDELGLKFAEDVCSLPKPAEGSDTQSGESQYPPVTFLDQVTKEQESMVTTITPVEQETVLTNVASFGDTVFADMVDPNKEEVTETRSTGQMCKGYAFGEPMNSNGIDLELDPNTYQFADEEVRVKQSWRPFVILYHRFFENFETETGSDIETQVLTGASFLNPAVFVRQYGRDAETLTGESGAFLYKDLANNQNEKLSSHYRIDLIRQIQAREAPQQSSASTVSVSKVVDMAQRQIFNIGPILSRGLPLTFGTAIQSTAMLQEMLTLFTADHDLTAMDAERISQALIHLPDSMLENVDSIQMELEEDDQRVILSEVQQSCFLQLGVAHRGVYQRNLVRALVKWGEGTLARDDQTPHQVLRQFKHEICGEKVPTFEEHPYAMKMLNMRRATSQDILLDWKPPSQDSRPHLAGDPNNEYDKNVVYGNYLYDPERKYSDPTLMHRLLEAMTFGFKDNGTALLEDHDPDAQTDPPFDVVLGTAHRSYGNVTNTQALLQLLSAMSNMVRIAKQLQQKGLTNELDGDPADYMLQVEEPEDSDVTADARFGIRDYHDALMPIKVRNFHTPIPDMTAQQEQSATELGLPTIPVELPVKVAAIKAADKVPIVIEEL